MNNYFRFGGRRSPGTDYSFHKFGGQFAVWVHCNGTPGTVTDGNNPEENDYCNSWTNYNSWTTCNGGVNWACIVIPADGGSSFEHVIPGLVTGQEYFVRVSAFNQLGYGIRRVTTPASVVVPVQAGTATSFTHVNSPPQLIVVDKTSVAVRFGPATFDGGDTMTGYKIEWDPSPFFNSSEHNSAKGYHVIASAGTQVCSDYVASLDVGSQTLNVAISSETLVLFMTGVRFSVSTFEDGSLGASNCIFTVASGLPRPTTSAIVVEDDHGCEYWDFSLTTPNRYGMTVLGGEYDIIGFGEDGSDGVLPTNEAVYARVFVKNQDVVWGAPILTSPFFVTPYDAPEPLSLVTLKEGSTPGSSLHVSWSPAISSGDAVTSYKIERFLRNSVAPDYGVQETQAMHIRGATGGTFTLAFGALVRELPGTVGVTQNSGHVQTSTDLTGFISRGDRIKIGSFEFIVHTNKPFPKRRILFIIH